MCIRDRPQDDRYTNRAGEQFLVMDRNLGAIGTDVKTRYGLVYTWGRKDPFTSVSYPHLDVYKRPLHERSVLSSWGRLDRRVP